MTNNAGEFGDIEKATRVFSINELLPIIKTLKELNDWLEIEVLRFKPYALAESAAPAGT